METEELYIPVFTKQIENLCPTEILKIERNPPTHEAATLTSPSPSALLSTSSEPAGWTQPSGAGGKFPENRILAQMCAKTEMLKTELVPGV